LTHQIGVSISPGYVDKRRLRQDDFETRVVTGAAVFTANATGTTTTIVGANAAPATGTNVARLGDEFKLFNSANVLKEEKVFRATAIAVAVSTTVTFTPAAAVASVSGDYYKLVGLSNQASTGEMDRRLVELGFSAVNIAKMTENDKLYQIRTSDDPGSI
jgi:hypothetical protein